MNAQEIGQLLKRRRNELKLTAAVAAGMMNKSTTHIMNIENKTSSTKLDSILAYMDFLGLHIDVKQTM